MIGAAAVVPAASLAAAEDVNTPATIPPATDLVDKHFASRGVNLFSPAVCHDILKIHARVLATQSFLANASCGSGHAFSNGETDVSGRLHERLESMVVSSLRARSCLHSSMITLFNLC
jgi:hypothetical protein